ncbi:MAG: tail fiber domain-containing protein, partial [Myxococcales bacterium]|nr:tail fiber domain-containing protein [Myxococcales bacterium]
GDDADADPRNETNLDLTFDGTSLALTDAAGELTVDLSALGDDADADPRNETNLDLTFDGTSLALTDAAGELTVDLSALGDDADADPRNETNTNLALNGTTLTLTDAAGALSVNLSALGDDADADPRNETNTNLAFDGTTLTLTDVAGVLSVNLSALGDDADADSRNETNTNLAFNGTILSLTDAAGVLSVDLAALDQTLALNGTDLSISGGNTVALAGLQDDLGSHTATQNLALSGFWLSNDGEDEGLFVSAAGKVGVGLSSPLHALDVDGDARISSSLYAGANSARSDAIDTGNTSVNRVYNPNANTRIWQSFTVVSTGLFVRLQVHLDSEPITGGVLEVYEGEGTGGALLLQQDFVDEGNGRRTIVLDTPVAVVAGTQYTIRLTNTAAAWRWRFNTTNVYNGGRASTNAAEDMDFRVYVTADPVLIEVDDSGIIHLADEAISVDIAGQVGIGTSAPAYALQVGEAGDGTEARANGWNVFSDARFKTDVKLIEDPLARLAAINGYTYFWKSAKNHDREVGVIAQEVEAVLPEVVTVDADGFRAVDYGKLSPLLIEALKAQQRMIEAQQEALDALRAENAEIRAALGLE